MAVITATAIAGGALTAGVVGAGVATGAAVAGAGAAVYGANKNAKSQAAAIQANKDSVASTDALNYQRWLESQGVGANGQSVNTWLPRNFTMDRPIGQPRRFRRAGTATPAAPAPEAPI